MSNWTAALRAQGVAGVAVGVHHGEAAGLALDTAKVHLGPPRSSLRVLHQSSPAIIRKIHSQGGDGSSLRSVQWLALTFMLLTYDTGRPNEARPTATGS